MVLQRAVLLTSLLVLAVGALWARAGPLLRMLGQDAELSEGAGRYLQLLLPALYFTGLFESFKRYLMAQVSVFEGELVALIREARYWAGLGKGGWLCGLGCQGLAS